MTKFDNISYLKTGNEKQQNVYRILTACSIMDKLADFSPILTGTIPIEVDIDESDLDILFYWNDKAYFKEAVSIFSSHKNFKIVNAVVNGFDTIIAKFIIDGFNLEVFGQNRPTKEQEAYRHLIIENQILQIKGERFKQEVINLKKKGVKTEPAFGLLLGLTGNPYIELLHYEMT